MPTPPETVDPPEGSASADGAANPADPAEGTRSRFAPYLKIFRRVVRTFSGVFHAHVIVIRAEAETELVRLLSGMALVIGAVMLMGVTALLGGVALVGLIQRLSGLPWLESLGLAMTSTASVALTLLGIAWLLLRRPLLPKSRQLLERTFDGFTRG